EVPVRVEQVILKGLELNRESRYSTAAEFSAELSKAVDLDCRYRPAAVTEPSTVPGFARTLGAPPTHRGAPPETQRTPDARIRSGRVRARIATAVGVVALAGITILGRSPMARFVRPVAAPVAQLSSESFSQDAQNALQSQTATVLAGSGSIGDAAKGTKKTDLRRQTATAPAGSGS